MYNTGRYMITIFSPVIPIINRNSQKNWDKRSRKKKKNNNHRIYFETGEEEEK